jgi:hypothetical protein
MENTEEEEVHKMDTCGLKETVQRGKSLQTRVIKQTWISYTFCCHSND